MNFKDKKQINVQLNKKEGRNSSLQNNQYPREFFYISSKLLEIKECNLRSPRESQNYKF